MKSKVRTWRMVFQLDQFISVCHSSEVGGGKLPSPDPALLPPTGSKDSQFAGLGDAEAKSQQAARGHSRANTVGVDLYFWVMANKPHRAAEIVMHFRNGVPGRTAWDHQNTVYRLETHPERRPLGIGTCRCDADDGAIRLVGQTSSPGYAVPP